MFSVILGYLLTVVLCFVLTHALMTGCITDPSPPPPTTLGARPVGFGDWLRLDEAETERGRRTGKPREKVTSVEEMRSIIWEGSR